MLQEKKINLGEPENISFNEQSKNLLVQIQSSLNRYLTPAVLERLSDAELDLFSAHVDAIKLSILNLKNLNDDDVNSELMFANLKILENSLKTSLSKTQPSLNDKLEIVSKQINEPLESVKPALNNIVSVVASVATILGSLVAIKNSYKALKD